MIGECMIFAAVAESQVGGSINSLCKTATYLSGSINLFCKLQIFNSYHNDMFQQQKHHYQNT
jgi:hypothetical protein